MDIVIEALLVALESVPAEYRSLVKFHVDSEYESSSVLIEARYSRPETEDEEIVRLAAEESIRQQKAQEGEAYLRQQYEALKRKFEPSIAPRQTEGENQ